MTGKERIGNILKHKPTDRIGVYESFWSDTFKAYSEAGYLGKDERADVHFDWDIVMSWPFNLTADLDFVPETVSETEDTYTVLDGNGAMLKRHKFHDTTPEHIGYKVTCREEWEKIKPLLTKIDERRINFEYYRKEKAFAEKHGKFFVWGGVNVFECMHPVCGHEHLLVGMALDPEWVQDMSKTYAGLTIKLQEILFAREGKPDGVWYYEDMGFKERPFFSADMYREMIMPYHRQTIGYAHKLGLPVIMHSCGFIEPLLPHMIEAGIDCLQVIEIKAGMDLLRIYEKYGKQIALMGGIDVRVLYTNDKKLIDKELEAKIPVVKQNHGYILHSDHSIPKTVDYKTYKYFLKKGLALGAYEKIEK